MKIRLDEKEGMGPGQAIEVETTQKTPTTLVSVTIWNDDTSTSIELNGERARQIAMALISGTGGGGDAG